MFQLNTITLVSFIAALSPILIWMYIFFSDDNKIKEKSLNIKIFLGGILTVPFILGIYKTYSIFIQKFPDLNLILSLKSSVTFIQWIILTNLFVGLIEELTKFYITRFSDKNYPELITNINQALKFGILTALGFAFIENMLYFTRDFLYADFNLTAYFQYLFTNCSSLTDSVANVACSKYHNFTIIVLFRSVFTVCAHLCFSGIFAYYYGISKFSKDFINFKKWIGQKVTIKEYQKFRNKNIAIGLGFAIAAHALHNILLDLGTYHPIFFNVAGKEIQLYTLLTISLIIGMFIFLNFLLSRKIGNLTFVLADRHKSLIPLKDKEVVLELLGMWFNEGRYEEVDQICNRLLQRDPDNNVVKIFKAKAQDKLNIEQN